MVVDASFLGHATGKQESVTGEHEARHRAEPTDPEVSGGEDGQPAPQSSPLCVLTPVIRALLVPCTFEALSRD